MATQPASADAAAAVRSALGVDASTVRRFPTGLAHYVYDVTTADGRRVVVRMAGDVAAEELRAGAEWSRRLRPLGVPLPAELARDLEGRFPFVVLERLPGADLGDVYPRLSPADKTSLAAELVRIQRMVHALTPGTRFGYAATPDGGSFSSWTQMIEQGHAGVVGKLRRAGRSLPVVDRVSARLPALRGYLDAIAPVAFLDDTTTKNVIVEAGRLSGIVDVDGICYGDPLLALGLTHMSLQQLGHDLDYVRAWADALGLSPFEREVVGVYAALFGCSFLHEMAQRYNRDRAPEVDPAAVARLAANIEAALGESPS